MTDDTGLRSKRTMSAGLAKRSGVRRPGAALADSATALTGIVDLLRSGRAAFVRLVAGRDARRLRARRPALRFACDHDRSERCRPLESRSDLECGGLAPLSVTAQRSDGNR